MSDQFTIATKHWHRLDDGRIQCDVCPAPAGSTRASGDCVSSVLASTTRSS
ncbi:putative PYRUVATE FORMATE LYASE ACTIVATING PROTEIN PFLA domain protein [Mycobacterium xenopi 4042]|uniref:Putative PYRUVATE FORMATE LYASE ACTIVATING PROTEIN PFLA domain protein n=1 Tax=Mycobacterium xenopi 4042 TaxID=1299334 RepID=X7Z5B5_MYCXE|nr:putative PYRUVATE FORMATE LYASE ACTIVATING PROTEIN PFLA domain protein [Mycobacterium xenopi 4042]